MRYLPMVDGIPDIRVLFFHLPLYHYCFKYGLKYSPVTDLGSDGDLLRRSHGNDTAALVAAFGAKVDDMVGALDDVEVMLDDDDGIAFVDKLADDGHEQQNVFEVQARGRFVEDIDRLSGATGAPALRRA